MPFQMVGGVGRGMGVLDGGRDVTRGPRTLKISWESPNTGWKDGREDGTFNPFQDVVGCARGRGTSPEPLKPGNNR